MSQKLQEEAEKVTSIIQPIHEKMRQDLGSTRMTTSEHISSELVEQLKIVHEEVRQET